MIVNLTLTPTLTLTLTLPLPLPLPLPPSQAVELETRHDAAARTLLVRKPPVRVGEPFTIELLG